jgi:hypothetical protein
MLPDTTSNSPLAVQAPTQVAGPGGTTFQASVSVMIAGHPFTLDGSLDVKGIVVEYHAPFDKAVNLGTITSVATEIGNALGFSDLATDLTTTQQSIFGGGGPLASLALAIEQIQIRITDLVINQATSTYGIGLALDFTGLNPPPTLFNITLLSVGFKVTKTKTTTP